MAYTKQDLMKLDGAEVVGGNIIHGTLSNRVFVGKISEEGVFFITPEGEARLKALEEGGQVESLRELLRGTTGSQVNL
jgi:hypothetical protein